MAKSNQEHPRKCMAMGTLDHLRIRLGRNTTDFYFVDTCTCWLYVEMTGYVNLPFRVVVKVYWCSSLLIFWVTTLNLWSSFRYISTEVWCVCRVVVVVFWRSGYGRHHGRLSFQLLRSPHLLDGNWTELMFAKTCGSVARDREKNWPMADRHIPSYHPRGLCKS